MRETLKRVDEKPYRVGETRKREDEMAYRVSYNLKRLKLAHRLFRNPAVTL
ncbi:MULTISPECIES: hypothetical protein [Calothrix]|uniref:Transposase n=2 Tax=Calothrix TaxID=1186 RepID=A0ABR8A4I3_9CYAN|nr:MULTISPECIES: hypothetical protein [Calothrix]MBD2194855.1 hypothetical protein [Calothrix parietina FACHB-288]MBD2223453.1 hypothetical protein [Calothrix anomala FACHB-343]